MPIISLNKHYPTNEWFDVTAPHIQEAYHNIGSFINVDASWDFLLTSTGAEAINTALFSIYLEQSRNNGKTHFVSSHLEDAPIMMSLARLEKLGCFTSLVAPSKKGQIDPQSILEAITPRTACVSLSCAQADLGVIQPIEEIGHICREKGVLFFVEASPMLLTYEIDWNEMPVDAISFSGEILFGGFCGAVFFRNKNILTPFVLGNEFNPNLIEELSQACKQAKEERTYFSSEVCRLKYLFEEMLLEKIPQAKILFSEELRLPHTSCIFFPKVHGEALHYYLLQNKVISHIGGGTIQRLSDRLTHCGFESEIAFSSLSFGLGHIDEDEVRKSVFFIEQAYKSALNISGGLF